MFEDAEAELTRQALETGRIGGRVTVGKADGIAPDGTGAGAGFEEAQAEDDGYLYDAEEARICLSCPRARCPLDENKACVRYRRALRALRRRRTLAEAPAAAATAEGGAG